MLKTEPEDSYKLREKLFQKLIESSEGDGVE